MNLYSYQKLNNFNIFSPRIESSNRRLKLNNENNFGNFHEFSNEGNNKPINLYFSPKNVSNSKMPKIYSALHKKLNKLYRSSSQNNFHQRPFSSNNNRGLPSVQSFSFIKSPRSKSRNRKKAMNKKQNYFNFEKEKLYQETYQIKKVVNLLTKKLSLLKKENYKRDKLINKKQKKINDIILNNNNSLYENNEYQINNNNKSLNDYNSDSNENNLSINSNLNFKNTPTLNLFIKIKNAIEEIKKDINQEKNKYEMLKRSPFLTKMNELKTESFLLGEQINKINLFINKAFLVQEENNRQKQDYLNLKENIDKQFEIIRSLEENSNILKKEENELKDQLKIIKNNLKSKNKQININKNKLDILLEKNNNLSSDKNLFKQSYTIKVNSNPIEIKSFYTSQISKLNKLINFFTIQCKYSDNEINKLNNIKKNLLGPEKISKKNQFESISYKSENISNIEKIENLKKILKDSIDSEKKMKKKLDLYQNKLKELESQNKIDDISNKSQIEFGIDNDNPYYTENSENKPEKSGKFTSSQFNQFTYILFKSFESKGISFEESKNAIINPFLDFIKNNKISNIKYPSKEFDLITDKYTKIIMKVLNCDNEYNYTLTKIFISALFFNSNCTINKLIEYFNVLFSYTKNYNFEESKYINKLQNKYKIQTEKLITCIKKSISKDLNSSKYFHLLKMKELLENNEINLKDKYIEFLFYYMKKFDDPKAKLEDLKFSKLKDIIPLEILENNNSKEINIIYGKEENSNSNDDVPQKFKDKSKNSKKESSKSKDKDKFVKNGKKSVTEENYSQKPNMIPTNAKDDSEFEDNEDSMTEITNEEYIKQLIEAISLIYEGLKAGSTNFNDLMANVVQQRKINGNFYECITIEDFNEQLKSINVVLSDLKLSCLCSKYSIPNELRLIDKNKIEKDIERHKKGELKLDEEENGDNN